MKRGLTDVQLEQLLVSLMVFMTTAPVALPWVTRDALGGSVVYMTEYDLTSGLYPEVELGETGLLTASN